jgi:hypothetical protein
MQIPQQEFAGEPVKAASARIPPASYISVENQVAASQPNCSGM